MIHIFEDNQKRLSPTPSNVEALTNTGRTPSLVLSTHNVSHAPVTIDGPYTPPSSSPSNLRWAILGTGSFILLGNYFAYDNIAALNTPLQEYLQLSDQQYDYVLNLLYTVYSIPNVILPWIGGYAVNRFGNRTLIITLSILVTLGHLIVCLGLERKHVPVMALGRVIFGAAESLSVAQATITVKYFRGKELALALGINLCVSRLGSVLNDVVTPFIWSRSSVPIAFWGGFVSCVISLITAFLLVWLDWRYGCNVAQIAPLDRSRRSSCLVDATLSTEVLRSHAGTSIKSASPPPLPSIREIAMEKMKDYESKCLHDNHIDDSDSTLTLEKDSLFKRSVRSVKSLVDYSASFWILCAMTFLIIGIMVPFNSIHAGFLQMRWYPGNPVKAAQIMTVPDLLAALLVLPIGYIVDHYGRKSWLFMLCGLIIGTSHLVLGLFKIPTPIPCLLALGISSGIGAVFSSAIPVLVPVEQMATAYGIFASSYNLAFVVLPMIIAKLMTIDPTVYTYTEIFFSSLGYLGFLFAVWLKLLDRNGELDKKEIDNIPQNAEESA